MSKEFERFVLCPPLLHAGIGYNLFSIQNQKLQPPQIRLKAKNNIFSSLKAREKKSWRKST
jgi:hypothetical protein